MAFHASQMFGKNMENLLNLLIDDNGELQLDFEDEIVAETVISHDGDVPQARLRDILGLPALAKPEPEAAEEASDADSKEEK